MTTYVASAAIALSRKAFNEPLETINILRVEVGVKTKEEMVGICYLQVQKDYADWKLDGILTHITEINHD